MEELRINHISWINFFLLSAALLGGYLLLRRAGSLWPGLEAGRGFRGRIKQAAHFLLAVYEPAAILIAGGAFVLVSPLLHGALLLLLFLAGFSHVRNYVSGRIVRFNGTVSPGSRLQTREVRGIVSRLGNLGLHLKTGDGLFFIAYSRLLADGFTLIAGEEMGGFFLLRISAGEADKKALLSPVQLMDLLASAPYVDGRHKPELIPPETGNEYLDARVLLREENHLFELIQLMKEWGLDCRMVDEQ